MNISARAARQIRSGIRLAKLKPEEVPWGKWQRTVAGIGGVTRHRKGGHRNNSLRARAFILTRQSLVALAA